MNLLDRYIFRSVLGTCLGAISLFAFVLIIGNLMKEVAPYLFAGQIEMATAFRLFSLLIPFVITFALPMGILTGVLLTLGRLSADSEITAMRACGLALTRITRPILFLGIILAGLALYINHETMPWARSTYKKEMAEALRSNPLSLLVPRTFIRQFPGFVVYVGEKKGGELSDFWLWQLDKEQRVVREIHAAKGLIDYDEAGNTLILTLKKAIVELRDAKAPESAAEAPSIGSFEENEAVRLPLDAMFTKGGARTKLDFLSRTELDAEYARDLVTPPKETPQQKKDRERQLTRINLVISERFNNAFAVFSFALIGIPLGIKVSRRETSANLGVAVGLALGYYFLTTAIGWLDKSPQWHPWLLLYLPNLLVCFVALMLFRRLERR